MSSQTGIIQYWFKGKQMANEEGVTIKKNKTVLTVKRSGDGQTLNFIRHKDKWILDKSLNSLLVGTEFIFE